MIGNNKNNPKVTQQKKSVIWRINKNHFFVYIFFVGFLGVTYISNQYLNMRMEKQIKELEENLKELRADYLEKNTEFTKLTGRKQIYKFGENNGLGIGKGKIQKIMVSK